MEIYTGEQLGKAMELERLGGINEDAHRNNFVKEIMIKELIKDEGVSNIDVEFLKKRDFKKYIEYSNKAKNIYGRERKRDLRSHYDFRRNEDREKILKIVENSQLTPDPTLPKTAWASDLRDKLLEKLKIDSKKIKYFSAVESCTEGVGIDAYFKIKVPGFKEENVYFDFTIDTLQSKGNSAHSVILSNYPLTNPQYDKDSEAEYIENFSNIIIENLKSKLNSQNS